MRLVLAEMKLVLAEIRLVQVAEIRLVQVAEIRLVQVAEMRLVQVAEMRLVQVAEMRLVQVTDMRLVPWAPPACLEGGDRIGQGGRHLTATNMLSAFSRFKQRGEVAVHFRLIQPAGWVLSVCFQPIQPAGGGGGEGGGGAVRFWLIQPAGEGEGCCLSAFG